LSFRRFSELNRLLDNWAVSFEDNLGAASSGGSKLSASTLISAK